MYTPRAFAQTDLALLDWLFVRDPFVTLISQGDDGQPAISHLPVLYRRDAQAVIIEGHWARPNPQARQPGDAVIVVQGPHAYVSPSWYTDKEATARVPTWNYAVAHLHGRYSRSCCSGKRCAGIASVHQLPRSRRAKARCPACTRWHGLNGTAYAGCLHYRFMAPLSACLPPPAPSGILRA
ncbi:transcriptional regulator protein Pai2 [Xanthomonas fragariae]|uniref:Transcriptional regulator protein Pai2 n=1 Tax=Xanthomonas fragariae TaxID=48664 RepID=A0A1Y6GUW4_9XANT|nr:transcriptional regulator protein Pai2 [Xanthomonas fragariae LMG 25863]SMQ95098.1 transcriptional regulator protein Pai2 [Xanthomonas fragariae]SMR03056.1 transcriptional regulator protein Pai2 [Xanthomonas fragariae]